MTSDDSDRSITTCAVEYATPVSGVAKERRAVVIPIVTAVNHDMQNNIDLEVNLGHDQRTFDQ
jgi:hypothetical protein